MGYLFGVKIKGLRVNIDKNRQPPPADPSVAKKVKAGDRYHRWDRSPAARKAMTNASVPELTAMACLAPK